MTTPEHTTNTPAAPAENADDMAANASVSAISPAPETRDIDQPPAPRPPVKFLWVELPGPISNFIHNAQDLGHRMRQSTIEAAPNAIANNSSNIIGMMQMVAEVLMFKSGGFNLLSKMVDGKEVKASRPLDYIKYPFQNVFLAVFHKSKFQGKLSDLAKPEFYKETYRSFTNLEHASKIDSLNGTQKLTNRFSARSGFAGIVAMLATAIFPDHKDTLEETEAAEKLSREHPARYVGKRVFQAVWFPVETVIQITKKIFNPGSDQGIGTHKREFAGLGMFASGILSFLSGFRQVRGDVIGKQYYSLNKWQAAGGVITAVAGSQLLLGIDNQQGWTRFGSLMNLRLLTLPFSIGDRFKGKDKEQGAKWYFAAQALLQAENTTAALIGGAEKLPDGTIVDHKAMREEAKKNVSEKRDKKPQISHFLDTAADATPPTTINASSVIDASKAMPERTGAEDQQVRLTPA